MCLDRFCKSLKYRDIFLSKNQATDLGSRTGADFRAIGKG